MMVFDEFGSANKMKMMMKLLVIVCTICLAQCDLLDLYVEHMDQAMRTKAYKDNRHDAFDLGRKVRTRRNTRNEANHYFKVGLWKKQSLEVDENYWDIARMKKKPNEERPTTNYDALEFPNDREQHREVDRYELIDEYFKSTAKNIRDQSKNSTWYNGPKKYQTPIDGRREHPKLSLKLDKANDHSNIESKARSTRSVKKPANFTRREMLDDDGDVFLEWDPSDDDTVTFKVIAKTLGYVGVGFNDKSHMMGADILIGWVDDHTGAVNLLVIFFLLHLKNLNHFLCAFPSHRSTVSSYSRH